MLWTDQRSAKGSLVRNRGPLFLISIAIAWGGSALFFWTLAEAHWQTVLWASLARLFLLLALTSGSMAMFLMLLRSMPDDESRRVRYLLCWVPGAVMAATAVWLATLELPELYMGLAAFMVAIGCLFTMERAFRPAARLELQRVTRRL
jgi:drug/metabolite transporter (DMT)-like permease